MPPQSLWARGDARRCCDRPLVAIVGTRKRHAVRRSRGARRSRRTLARAGACVVSGWRAASTARRIAPRSTRERRTVAVLGTGVDVAYPRRIARCSAHRERGLLLSELAPGARGHAARFRAATASSRRSRAHDRRRGGGEERRADHGRRTRSSSVARWRRAGPDRRAAERRHATRCCATVQHRSSRSWPMPLRSLGLTPPIRRADDPESRRPPSARYGRAGRRCARPRHARTVRGRCRPRDCLAAVTRSSCAALDRVRAHRRDPRVA